MTINLSVPNDNNEAVDVKKAKSKSRVISNRESEKRVYYETDSWLTIPPHVEQDFLSRGYKLGWLRIYLNGEEDYKAVGQKIAAGWEFVSKDEVPDMTVGYGYHKAEDRFEDAIVRGDVALAKMLTHVFDAHKQRGLDKNRQMNDAINHRLNSMQDKRMPISNNSKSRVTVGGKAASFDRD